MCKSPNPSLTLVLFSTLQMKGTSSPVRNGRPSASNSPDEKTPLMVINVDKQQKV